jgi:hypothetical protein
VGWTAPAAGSDRVRSARVSRTMRGPARVALRRR